MEELRVKIVRILNEQQDYVQILFNNKQLEELNMNENKGNIFSILALVFGIMGLVTSCLVIGIFPAIPGVIFGIMALNNKQSKGMAITGLVCGAVGIVISLFMLSLVFR